MNLIKFYNDMMRIRLVEEKIASEYSKQQMRCPVHLSIGQEAIAVGASNAVNKSDYYFSNHRSHAHYLSKGGDLKKMLSEIYLKETGCCNGRGGSMHSNDMSVNFVGAVPIVGSSIPIAVGAGLQIKIRKQENVSIVFFGDAATEEGVFYESLNFAALKKLPVIFICENNFFSVYSPLSVRVPSGRNLIKMADSLGLCGFSGDGNNVIEVNQLVKDAVDRAKAGEGPTLLEFKTYRHLEHCGTNNDNHLQYRSLEDYSHWMQRDPILMLESKLEKMNQLKQQEKENHIKKLTSEIEDAFIFAERSAYPDKSTLLDNVYAN